MSVKDPEEERLFPREGCVKVFTELNAWTPIQAILAAARDVEGRKFSEDRLEGQLIMPMPHGQLFEAVFLRTIAWMVESYRVPNPKIALARATDPAITDETEAGLRAARFNPTIRRAPLAAFDKSVAAPPGGPNAFIIDDQPFVIELVMAPLRCLMDILTFSFESARDAHDIGVIARETTGGAPTIFHRPYADSRLYATLEALCYYAHGLMIGPLETPEGASQLDISYRAVNVRSRPPVDAGLLSLARTSMEEMLHGLR
ncbi:hypothetical protein GOC68_29380 [Sinorhizobium medicae]|nr:hypothetical protein [Sinorhizobium medicae]